VFYLEQDYKEPPTFCQEYWQKFENMFDFGPFLEYSFDKAQLGTFERVIMDASKPSRRATTLSAMQERILQAIQRSKTERGYVPSMREIGDEVGLSSPSSVTHQLNQLELA
jgi:hypothetical protein